MLITKPLVSIICLCYNQKAYVQKAIESVWHQTYGNIELIVVDDCSIDGSKEVIKALLSGKKVTFIDLEENLGGTAAFNKGFEIAKGDYIIDLAADDILDIDRVKKQVVFFRSCKKKIGVIYSDAIYIDECGGKLNAHFSNKKLNTYTGDIYQNIIEQYFIPTQTMMIKRIVLEKLNGYDETLVYEDFDFWVRSSRNWDYEYQSEALTFIRKTNNSLSSRAYLPKSEQVRSTYQVCEKIKALNKNTSEDKSLIARLKYEFRQAAFSGNNNTATLFYTLLLEMKGSTPVYNWLYQINKLKIDFSAIRNLYLRVRYFL